MNDLDFKGADQLPIGTKDKPFTGILDGNGFSISNYQLQQIESSTHFGLFAYAKNATFRNFQIKDTRLTIGNDWNLELYGGLLLGQGESVTIENIQIASSVSVAIQPLFKSTVGGIVGELKGTSLKPSNVYNVLNSGEISGKYRIGGIVGSASYTKIESAKNYGVIKGGDSAGGIVGYLFQSKLFQAENDGDIKSTQSSGGIVGNASYSIVEIALNKGFVQSSGSWSDVGGIIGFMRKTNLTDAKNTGSFSGKGSQTDIGGLVGDAGQESIIRNGMNQSDIITSDSSIGGIVGEVYQSLIQQTYNEGDLSGSTGGGISSAISNSVIQNSFNIGKIQGSVTSGGLVGYAYQDSRIESSYNSGFVRRSYLHGALAGKYEGTMQSVYGITQSRLIGEGE
ncbi:GLUG motif-containing protein, partial [Exiguobacterium profundum]|uniref:GLUG motif-containing protein n=1 Tax=Exiguobacterium profundum TaxID=307643 RepID=UPI00391B9E3E